MNPYISVESARRGSRFPRSGCRDLWLAVLLLAALAAAGCTRVPAHRQRLVSKPNMQFSDSLVFGYQNRLLTQIESGSASFGGAQSAGCASCGVGGGK
jgi:hypothetical protein